MTEPNRLRSLERQLRQSIGSLTPFCQFIPFLTAFLVALLAERTVSLSWIAHALPTEAKPESNRRRIQRFLDDRRLTPATFARIVAAFLPPTPWILALDRTNWFWGKTPLNLLVLAVILTSKDRADRSVAVPLLWTPLARDGASDTGQRKALLGQFLTLFGRAKIDYVTADREFIGGEWIAWLRAERVPFRIRLRKDDLVADQAGAVFEVAALFERRSSPCRKNPFVLWGSPVYLGGKRLAGEDNFLVIASDAPGSLLEDYRRRWSIECLFQALKGRGFHLEETRVTDAHRLSVLLGLLALGYLWCVCAGQALPERVSRSLGRSRQSACRRGLDLVHRVALGLVRQPEPWQWEHAFCCLRPRKT
jgi:hypothetical protein